MPVRQASQRPAGEYASHGQRNGLRESPARITRVTDLMVFVETDGVGLVFKPEKIVDYRGEPLDSIGFVVGALIPKVTWDPETLKVVSVARAEVSGNLP